MSSEKNVQTVIDFFAIGRGDKEGLLTLVAEDIESARRGEGRGCVRDTWNEVQS
ncbi:hypothetical protein [Singulisphaera sp. PoT]|uniref:hypothetical protein n=1 Tax=Singulisphaera sp. PoT TaxID=3411797 RepID=UPI003BF56D04